MSNANEEVQNQEEEVIEEEQEYESGNNEEETEETTEESPSTDDGDETVTLSKSDYDRLQRGLARKARLEGKGKESGKQDSKESSKNSTEGYDQDLISRTYLAAQAGITDPDIQDEALRLSEKFGMKIDQAMKDSDISSRLQNLQKQKQTQAGVSGNGGQTVAKPRSIEQYTNEFKKTGKLPDDPKLVSKILDQLTK